MASIFTHAIAATSISGPFALKENKFKILLLVAICSMIPDADVIMFKFGIPYEHILGHRGLSHSIIFALATGILVSRLFFRTYSLFSKQTILLITIFTFSTASHGLLDAMTTGGLGVGFFIPFDNTRYFLPFRPIQVSPIGIENFFGEWGIRVLKSEFQWVVLPCLAFNFVINVIKKLIKRLKLYQNHE